MARSPRQPPHPSRPNLPPESPVPPESRDSPLPLAIDDDDQVIDLEAEPEPAGGAEAEDEERGPEHRRLVIRKDANKRCDVYLQQRLKGISRNKIQQLIARGGVTVNDRPPKPSTLIHAGDVIDIILPPRAVKTIEPEPIPLEILHEDEDLIVLNKQAGLIVHPARSNPSGTLVNALAYRFKEQREAAGLPWEKRQTRGFKRRDREPTGAVRGLSSVGAAEFRPGIVHRLDRNTTGVIVVAKNDEAHWAIARQFENRTTLKAYLALVHGNFDSVGGVIEQPVGKHPTIREAHAVRHDSLGKHAVTLYRVREQYRGYALVELELKTGRTHQIRVHLSYLGHPIAGDIIYGGEPVGEREIEQPPQAAGSRQFLVYAREREEGQRIEQEAAARADMILTHPALHAAFLQFVHPRTNQRTTWTAPLHEPFLGLVHRLRRHRLDAPIATAGYWIDLAQAVPAAHG